MTAILEQLQKSEHARSERRTETFEQLARQVADDANLDPDDVVETLHELDRTAEELATAAELVISRREWASQLPREAELEAEHNAIYDAQQRDDAAFEDGVRQLKSKHAARRDTRQQRLAAVATERALCGAARNKLLQTSPGREQLAKLRLERAAAVISLEGELHAALRAARPLDRGFCQGEILRTQALADRLAVEIAQLEQGALLP